MPHRECNVAEPRASDPDIARLWTKRRRHLLRPHSLVLVMFSTLGYRKRMTDPSDKLTPATPEDVADALAFALRFQGRKRVQRGRDHVGDRRQAPSRAP
jgi:hypothetical protein